MENNSNTVLIASQRYSVRRKEFGELSERDEAALYSQCLEEQLLKAPASAVFPSLSEVIVNGGNWTYSVTSYVDSQNSYGAMIRTNYTFNIMKTEAGWTCLDQFVSTESVVERKVSNSILSHTILYWILGIIGTIITFLIIKAQIGI